MHFFGSLQNLAPFLAAATLFGLESDDSMRKVLFWEIITVSHLQLSYLCLKPLYRATVRLSLVGIAATFLSAPLSTFGQSSISTSSSTPVVYSSSPNYVTAGTTTTVTVHGADFVPGTILSVSQGTVTTTYQSANYVSAQITVPANATGIVSLQATNPSSSTPSSPLSLAVWYLQFTASDSDGNNTGSARLGLPVNLSANFYAGGHSAITWTLQGAGQLKYGSSSETTNVEIYTPPQVMPPDSTVTITAYMTSYPSLQASYTFKLKNPPPTLASVSPSQLLTGGTQSVTISGSGFVPTTTVSTSGNALSTTYVSYNQIAVQVPVSASAQGNVKLQVENHSPGGGTADIQEPVAPNSITLTATDSDGTNTGTSELQNTVNVTAAVSGSLQTSVNWSLQGAGSLSSSGVYTAPTLMPSNNVVVITAALASNPAISASYSLNLINPVPVISSVSPLNVPPGTTTTLTITGTGFVPGTVLSTDTGTITTTFQSGTSLTANLTLPSSAGGNFNLQAQNPTPGGGAGPYFEDSITTPISLTAAARLLDQTTFGPTTSLIQHVANEGVDAWLQEQFNTPQTVLPYVPVPEPSYCALSSAKCAQSYWWQTVLTGNDQLRQRVAFALSEIFVVSIDSEPGYAIPYYANTLAQDAFGNWNTIMWDVARSPAMGVYLNMLNSAAATGNTIANENFARENMQLFNLGEYLLNQDGSQQLQGGSPIPTYTEAQVQAFARAFTGWTYANADGSAPSSFTGATNYNHALVAVDKYHDKSSKVLLNGTVLPPGQTAHLDLYQALNNVFQHPNVPPFVCKQLIQHLVTSDPSPDYVSRVAAVFTSDENGVRGNMQAVIQAILTDPEARAADTDQTVDGGHLREPILWTTAVMRGLGFVNTDPNNIYNALTFETKTLNEDPYEAASVFNFFPPSYTIPQTTIVAPEFGIENSATVMLRMSLADKLVNNQIPTFNVDLSATSPLGQLASNPANLVQQLNVLFMHSVMDPNMTSAITNTISSLSDPGQRVRVATYLVVTSDQYKVMH